MTEGCQSRKHPRTQHGRHRTQQQVQMSTSKNRRNTSRKRSTSSSSDRQWAWLRCRAYRNASHIANGPAFTSTRTHTHSETYGESNKDATTGDGQRRRWTYVSAQSPAEASATGCDCRPAASLPQFETVAVGSFRWRFAADSKFPMGRLVDTNTQQHEQVNKIKFKCVFTSRDSTTFCRRSKYGNGCRVVLIIFTEE